MVNTKTRKAVYIPDELWVKLEAEGSPRFDTVTVTLKNILLAHFNGGNNTKTEKDPVSTGNMDEQF